ncbi:hypothetical protein ACTFIY_008871 [Dictyostelium cf. discoideum]
MNLFTIHFSHNGVDPTLKTLMDNGAASNELLQSLQPTLNESVKNNDRIEGETLKKLINRNFRSKTLVSIKTDNFSRKRSSDSLSNNGEKFPMKKNHAVPNHNSHNRVFNDAQADKIRAAILPELKGDSKVNFTKIRNSFLVYRYTKGYCLNCCRSNHKTSNCRLDPVDSKVDPSGQSAKKQQ